MIPNERAQPNPNPSSTKGFRERGRGRGRWQPPTAGSRGLATEATHPLITDRPRIPWG